MATGRTISASHTTKLDDEILTLCEELADCMSASISSERRDDFAQNYTKISRSRDAGTGRGGGKLQRDALCTRGRQGKAPFSNRNFRWHPLIVADEKPNFAEEIDAVQIEGEPNADALVFVTAEDAAYPSDKVHKIPERRVVLPRHWIPHLQTLRCWTNTQWTQNSCVISAMEAANWWDAVESYAVLGISVAINLYEANPKEMYESVLEILSSSTIQNSPMPSCRFPSLDSEITLCPVCKKPFHHDLSEFRNEERPMAWQPSWGSAKKREGDDSSIQLMHVNPLVESEMRHNAENVRYGHRWCNIAMTDHSIDETLDFMKHIVKVHTQ